jgi:polysaccharide export outer membrane protein
MRLTPLSLTSIVVLTCTVASVAAQQSGRANAQIAAAGGGATTLSPTPSPGYVIGPADILSIVFWRDKEMSADVVVRPDGRISLPVIGEIAAAGYTPEQLRTRLTEAAGKYLEEPDATVNVKEIRSRNVYITGNVTKPSTYPLNGEMTVLQLIAVAGGLLEYADSKNIMVIHTEGGRQQYHKFNYKDVVRQQKHAAQNIVLKPGDTVVVP